MGLSACVFSSALAALRADDGRLYCVDLFDQLLTPEYLSYPLVRQILDYAGSARSQYADLSSLTSVSDAFDLTVSRFQPMQMNTTKIQSDSGSDWNVTKTMFDFSYIDGDHAYHAVRRDTLLVLGYATDNHVIVFDDYSTQFPGVPRFVEEMRECKGVEQIAHVHPDIAFVVQKPSTFLHRFGVPVGNGGSLSLDHPLSEEVGLWDFDGSKDRMCGRCHGI